MRAGVDERTESGISQTRLVHYCERRWGGARVEEGQRLDSAVPGSSRSRLGDGSKGDRRTNQGKGCWKLPLKDYHSLMLENEFYLFNSHQTGLFSGYKGSQGFLLVTLAATDLATWRSAGPTAGLSFSCSRALPLSRRQIASTVPRLARG